MSKLDKIKTDKLIHKLGLKYNLTDETIKKLVESPYEFTAEKLQEIHFDEIETQEQLDEMKTTFMYKSFGRLYISFPMIKRRIDRKKNKLNLNKNGRSK